MTGRELVLRPNVEHDDLARARLRRQLVPRDRAHHLIVLAVPARQHHAGRVAMGDGLHGNHQLQHVVTGDPVQHPVPVATTQHEPRAAQLLQMRRHGRHARRGRRRQRLNGAFALGEQVQQLKARRIGERLADLREEIRPKFHRSLDVTGIRRGAQVTGSDVTCARR
jgi:hypothetical protein